MNAMRLLLIVSVFIGVAVRVSLCNTSSSSDSGSACLGPKGEKGDVGHIGARGLRGYGGEKGNPGPAGQDGEKGDPGEAGVAGPAGTAGRDGEQGSAGPIGPRGLKGHRGVTGDKGAVGPQGSAGADGEAGQPGHTGPVGPCGAKGVKGDRGIPGHSGSPGPQGVAGKPLDEETLKTFIAPLQLQIAELNAIVQRGTADRPLAHLYGPHSGNYQQYSGGTVITNWHTGTGQRYSPILRGGMTYSNGYITVPTQGVYYVYGQLFYYPFSSLARCGLQIEVGSTAILYSYENKIGSNEWRSQYAGQVKTLNKGDKLVMKVQNSCQYYFDSQHTLFGVFLL